MQKQDRIFVAGYRGLVGSAIVRRLRTEGYENLILRTRAELDLTEQDSVRTFFSQQRPDYVLLAAAKVGGILANGIYGADFIRDNLLVQMQCNRRSLSGEGSKAGVSGIVLHLSEGCSTAHERRVFTERDTGTHERALRGR